MTLLKQSVFKELEDMEEGMREIAAEMGLNPDVPWRNLMDHIIEEHRLLKREYTAMLNDDWSEFDELYPEGIEDYGDDAYEEGLNYLYGSME